MDARESAAAAHSGLTTEMREGLRILARLLVRAYLKDRAASTATESIKPEGADRE
jgi:hypothetical protein